MCGVNEDNTLVIWHIETAEMLCSFTFPTGEFDVVKVMQPTQYSQKILVASSNGKMQLINYIQKKVVYAFSLDCAITTLEQVNTDIIAGGLYMG